jgi:hypothetical protein
MILYDVGSFSISDHFNRKDMNLLLQTLLHALPLRIVGAHISYTSKVYGIVLPYILFCLGKRIRARLCFHTHPETLLTEHLQYGLTTEALPTTMGGAFNFNSTIWKEERKRTEMRM